MVSFQKAYDIVMGCALELGAEQIHLTEALDRILAQDVISDADIPPFNKSSMDGYACRMEDLSKELTVIEEIPAGHFPVKRVEKSQCSKIMTGAPVPEGADCVVMIEQTKQITADRIRVTAEKTAVNISWKGEDTRAGEVVLRKGDLIGPAHVAVLASVGCADPLMARKARVGVVATGSELVEPWEKPAKGKIRNSNAYQLAAQISAMAAAARYYGIAGDTEDDLDTAVKRAKAENDIVLMSGGVSVGDYDLVPDVLRRNGFDLLIEGVAMQPGKPTVFGRDGEVYCCGLPGNPVATFVVFEILLKPFLYKLMGHDYKPIAVSAVLLGSVRRGKPDRQRTFPVRFVEPGKVTLTTYHGSAHIHALTRADGLITIPVGSDGVEEGATVYVRRL